MIENLYISCFIFKAHALQNHPKSAVLFHNFKEDVECDVLIKQEESVSLQFLKAKFHVMENRTVRLSEN